MKKKVWKPKRHEVPVLYYDIRAECWLVDISAVRKLTRKGIYIGSVKWAGGYLLSCFKKIRLMELK